MDESTAGSAPLDVTAWAGPEAGPSPTPVAPPLSPPAQPVSLGSASYWVTQPVSRTSDRYRPGRWRSAAAIVLLGVAGVVALAQAIHFYIGLGLVPRFSTHDVSLGEALAFDDLTTLLSRLDLGTTIFAAIAFLAWLSRSVDNLFPLRLGVPQPPASPRAAVGWWFVPLAAYVMPYRIVADLRRRVSDASYGALVTAGWWAAWLGQATLSVYVLVTSRANATDLGTIGRTWALLVVAETIRTLAAVLGIVVVMTIATGIEARAARLDRPDPGPFG